MVGTRDGGKSFFIKWKELVLGSRKTWAFGKWFGPHLLGKVI
ncbi:hypothetical protein ADIS_4237 [Lunatimonas lonarensis]|uniref:Uncharacterized protein n=1 Tax=Lunatimonas lonarensis TaxID=1232681 RepID=R7ZMT1_9BACT|nr:hypothetical protein ADIS_4237 [Lunatimonas lonarensis]